MRADLKADTESAVTVLDGSEFHAATVLGKKECWNWVEHVCSGINA